MVHRKGKVYIVSIVLVVCWGHRLALTPDQFQFAYRFTGPQPLSRSQIESAAKAISAKFGVGTATNVDGSQLPALAFEHEIGLLLYTPPTGVIQVFPNTSDTMVTHFETLMVPLLKEGGLAEKDIASAEIQAVFVFDTPPTALAVIRRLDSNVPSWVGSVLKGESQKWCLRFVLASASSVASPLRLVTPWHEISLDPLADNPKRLVVKFLFRESTWGQLKEVVMSLPNRAEEVRKVLAE